MPSKPIVKPEDLLTALTESPILTEDDIKQALNHSSLWQRELVLLVRKRASERLASTINDLVRAAEMASESQLKQVSQNVPLTSPQYCGKIFQ